MGQASVPEPPVPKTAYEILLEGNGVQFDEKARTAMTVSCRDCDYIPKVPGAGGFAQAGAETVQIMHNGVRVVKDGYDGSWVTEIISSLRGHHEPQEEKVFHECLQRIGDGGVMLELGSFWAYYSLWFNRQIPGAINICCEPDPRNLAVGQANAALNGANLRFIHAAAGKAPKAAMDFALESKPGETISVPVKTVDLIFEENKLEKLDLLHLDVQGAELDALHGAEHTLKSGRVRFVFVSTHHFLISADPFTHSRCLDYLQSLGAHIIAAHTVTESYSGDGLIAVSFDQRDRDFTVEVSCNHSDKSLFRSPEKDVAALLAGYEALRKQHEHQIWREKHEWLGWPRLRAQLRRVRFR